MDPESGTRGSLRLQRMGYCVSIHKQESLRMRGLQNNGCDRHTKWRPWAN